MLYVTYSYSKRDFPVKISFNFGSWKLFGSIQFVPIENYEKWMALALKQCIFDPMLVKPKCVWEAVVFFNFQKFVYIFSWLFTSFKKNQLPLKRILALPTWVQIYTVLGLQAFLSDFFQIEHPVWSSIWWRETEERISIFNSLPKPAFGQVEEAWWRVEISLDFFLIFFVIKSLFFSWK